jgi:hypothetical protein
VIRRFDDVGSKLHHANASLVDEAFNSNSAPPLRDTCDGVVIVTP